MIARNDPIVRVARFILGWKYKLALATIRGSDAMLRRVPGSFETSKRR
jgi:hypothetical protein